MLNYLGILRYIFIFVDGMILYTVEKLTTMKKGLIGELLPFPLISLLVRGWLPTLLYDVKLFSDPFFANKQSFGAL